MNIFLVVISLFSLEAFGQETDNLGLGSNIYLNNQEILLVDSILASTDSKVNYNGVKVAFFAGNGKETTIVSKKDFFDQFITPYAEKGELPKFSVEFVTEEDLEKTGGYGIIFSSHTAHVTEKLIKKLRKSTNT